MEPTPRITVSDLKEMVICQICDANTSDTITMLGCLHIICNSEACSEGLWEQTLQVKSSQPGGANVLALYRNPLEPRPAGRWCKICRTETQQLDLTSREEAEDLNRYHNVLKQVYDKLTKVEHKNQICHSCPTDISSHPNWYKCYSCYSAGSKGPNFKVICERCSRKHGHKTEEYNQDGDAWTLIESQYAIDLEFLGTQMQDTRIHIRNIMNKFQRNVVERAKSSIKHVWTTTVSVPSTPTSPTSFGSPELGSPSSGLASRSTSKTSLNALAAKTSLDDFTVIGGSSDLVKKEERKLTSCMRFMKHLQVQKDLCTLLLLSDLHPVIKQINFELLFDNVFSIKRFFYHTYIPYKDIRCAKARASTSSADVPETTDLICVPLLSSRAKANTRFADDAVIERFLAHRPPYNAPSLSQDAKFTEGSILKIDFQEKAQRKSVVFEVDCTDSRDPNEGLDTLVMRYFDNKQAPPLPRRYIMLESDLWITSDDRGVRITQARGGETLAELTPEKYGRALWYDHDGYTLYGLRPDTNEITIWKFEENFFVSVSSIGVDLHLYYTQSGPIPEFPHNENFKPFDTLAVVNKNLILICLSHLERELDDNVRGKITSAYSFPKTEEFLCKTIIIPPKCYDLPPTGDPSAVEFIISPVLLGVSSRPHLIMIDEKKPEKCLIVKVKNPKDAPYSWQWTSISVKHITKQKEDVAPITTGPITMDDFLFDKLDQENYHVKIIKEASGQRHGYYGYRVLTSEFTM